MTTTRAEIPAETAAAHHSAYDPAVPIDHIAPHPDNIRHDAVADDELVDSIRENGLLQPLVIIPSEHREVHTAGGQVIRGDLTGYQLIAGHRRLDGLKRAGFTHAPAVIRHDLDDKADQLAAMLVENGRRADLSPVEEAEGFDLLTELGWKIDQISEATGRSKSLITARRRLTKLPEKARTAVHDGQVPIEHAIALAKLPSHEQTDLERHLGGPSFKYELQRTQARVERKAEVDQEIADLRARGVTKRDLPAGIHNAFMLNHADHGMVRIEHTGATEAADHDGCLAFISDGTRQWPSISLVCTDPSQHDDQLTEQQRERQAANAELEAERQQRLAQEREQREATKIARQLRCDAAMSLVKPNPKIDPGLEALLRVALPDVLQNLGYSAGLADLLDVPDDDRERWDSPTSEWLQTATEEGTTPQLVKLLTAVLVDHVEQQLDMLHTESHYRDTLDDDERHLASSWFALLERAGHDRNDVDEDLLNALTATSSKGGD